jgi:protein gp37
VSGKTGIPYADAVWDPTRGCSHVSLGCKTCWAESIAKRFCGPGLPWEGFAEPGRGWTRKVALIPSALDWPLRKRAPLTIFVCSKSDLFHEALSDEDIDRVMATVERSRARRLGHIFLVLTKRAERMRAYCSTRELDTLPNLWLGVSVENRAALPRLDDLAATPAAHRLVSFEPLLEDLGDLSWSLIRIGQVIVGGESGPHARPCEVSWIRSIRDQCRAAGVPVYIKQFGSLGIIRCPQCGGVVGRVQGGFVDSCGKSHASLIEMMVKVRDHAGADQSEWPADLRVRELAWPLHKGER